jgi:hypothetical protein
MKHPCVHRLSRNRAELDGVPICKEARVEEPRALLALEVSKLSSLYTPVSELMKHRDSRATFMIPQDVIGELSAVSDLNIVEIPPLLLPRGAYTFKLPTSLTIGVVVIPTTHRDKNNVPTGGIFDGTLRKVTRQKPGIITIRQFEAIDVADTIVSIKRFKSGIQTITSKRLTTAKEIGDRIVASFKP